MIIERYSLPDKLGTFGISQIDGKKIYTVEQPWNSNIPFESCVPLGRYELVPYSSKKYGKVFALHNEEKNVFVENKGFGRYACLAFHKGNYVENFQGCIGAGDSFTIYNNKPMVTNTVSTCSMINEYLQDTGDRELIIISAEAG